MTHENILNTKGLLQNEGNQLKHEELHSYHKLQG